MTAPSEVPPRLPSPLRRPSEVQIRWRQFRHPPRPILRAVLSSLTVATVLGLAYLVYDIALTRGVVLPGGDLRTLAVTLFVLIVVISGSLITYLVVPQPTGSGTGRRRSAWSAALGLFASVPIAYLVLVVEGQILRPWLA
ncbi:MAG TPA: hypothetical protein VKR24_00335 [Candidatus Limnocylindrales bacterium]|nr:hypothetical protein [Candidatus Limnocylindrales bacterium]